MKTSQEIDKIIPAYLAAYHSVEAVQKKNVNTYYRSKYADLDAVMSACAKALKDNNLALWQSADEAGERMITRLWHVSGQWLEGTIPLILANNDMQGLGSAYTYARRYGALGILGIAPEDDDGNAAAEAKRAASKPAPAHVEEARTLMAEIKKLSDKKSLDEWVVSHADKLAEIKAASETTHDYLVQKLDERKSAIIEKEKARA